MKLPEPIESPHPEPTFTVSQVAKLFGVSRQTVLGHVRNEQTNLFPNAYRMWGGRGGVRGRWLIPERDVKAIMRRMRRTGRNQFIRS